MTTTTDTRKSAAKSTGNEPKAKTAAPAATNPKENATMTNEITDAKRELAERRTELKNMILAMKADKAVAEKALTDAIITAAAATDVDGTLTATVSVRQIEVATNASNRRVKNDLTRAGITLAPKGTTTTTHKRPQPGTPEWDVMLTAADAFQSLTGLSIGTAYTYISKAAKAAKK